MDEPEQALTPPDTSDELAQLRAENATLRQTVEQHTEVIADRRRELLQRLPVAVRDNYATVPLNLLTAIVTDFSQSQHTSPGVAQSTPPAAPTDLFALSADQQAELQQSNPVLYRSLLRKHVSSVGGRIN